MKLGFFITYVWNEALEDDVEEIGLLIGTEGGDGGRNFLIENSVGQVWQNLEVFRPQIRISSYLI